MGKIIDFKTRKPLEPNVKFYDRFERCHQNTIDYGKCYCDICVFKRETAYDLIEQAYDKCLAYNKNVSNELAWGDLLETLIIAAKTVKDYTNKKI